MCIGRNFEQYLLMQNMQVELVKLNYLKEIIMWTTPAATEMRFGFEVTMYVMNK